MDMIVYPATLNGTLTAPPSKSVSHRAVIAASLAQGVSRIEGIALNNDITATIGAVTALGAQVTQQGDTVTVNGIGGLIQNAEIRCGESGSTLRFMLPVTAALGASAVFYGEGRLPSRPIHTLLDELLKKGINTDYSGSMPFRIAGRLQNGSYSIDGGVSSQFVTGLLFALPLLGGDSEILIKGRLESRPYVDLTVSVLRRFGVAAERTESGYYVKAGQDYTNCNMIIEGDYSGAAFLLAAGALGGRISCEGLDNTSLQGDRAVVSLLAQFGSTVCYEGRGVTVSGGTLSAVEIDAADIPDLVPVLAVTAAYAEGTTIIKGAARLRIKESDRLFAVTTMLSGIGADIYETEDGLVITGKQTLTGGETQSFGDHRIAMSAAIAALRCKTPVIIRDAECVNKSYPDFFEVIKKLGGNCDVINMGR